MTSRSAQSTTPPRISRLSVEGIHAPETPHISMFYLYVDKHKKYVRIRNLDAIPGANVSAIFRPRK